MVLVTASGNMQHTVMSGNIIVFLSPYSPDVGVHEHNILGDFFVVAIMECHCWILTTIGYPEHPEEG